MASTSIDTDSSNKALARTNMSLGDFSKGKAALGIAVTTSVALAALGLVGSCMALGLTSFSLFTLIPLTAIVLTGTLLMKGPRNLFVQTAHTMEFIAALFFHPQFDTHGCWSGNVLANCAHFNDAGLAQKMISFLTKEKKGNADFRVVDLGCGNGFYVKQLRANGLNAQGFDGNPDTSKMAGDTEHFGVLDLAEKFNPKQVFKGPCNWVVSLEVGEHIPQEFTEIYVDNLVRSCRDGLIVSWAKPKQGGYSHVNEQSEAVIKELFASKGLINDPVAEKELRDSADLFWFHDTVMVFRKSN